MILLNASNLKKMFSDQTLFENVSFNISDSDKIGFIGVNGAGKSTLFHILTGGEDYDSGEIFRNKQLKVGYLDQYACAESEKSVIDEVREVFSEVISIEEELDGIRLDLEMGTGDTAALVARQTALNERFSELDGFYYMSRLKSTLTGLGFSEKEFAQKVSKLSGGQKTRVALAKILLSDANLLLLDEPTNHLDIDSVAWLEEFLRGYKGAFVVISHDRYFLDRVTNKTMELENGRMYSYGGNYSFYKAQREIDKKTEQREYDNTMAEIKRLEGIVEQQRRWNRERNIKTAESKIKVIEKLEKDLKKPAETIDEMSFGFRACPGGGQDVVIAEELAMSFGGREIFKNAAMHITKGEKVFLLGPNGCGKTTLLKILLGIYEPSAGRYKIGANIQIGYYDQIQENLSADKTVIEEIRDEYPQMTETHIRNALAAFLFKGEDVFKEIKKLSGGERARVELVKLILKSVNLLIMDEPTNHLDIESREALEKALDGYDGTMIMVSHDRYFINRLADRILYMTKDGLENYPGTYDEFCEKRVSGETESVGKRTSEKALDYKERKRLESEKRKVINRFKKVEERIAENDEKTAALNAELEKPEIATDYVKAAELTEEIAAVEALTEELFAEWEKLQEIIEENGYII